MLVPRRRKEVALNQPSAPLTVPPKGFLLGTADHILNYARLLRTYAPTPRARKGASIQLVAVAPPNYTDRQSKQVVWSRGQTLNPVFLEARVKL